MKKNYLLMAISALLMFIVLPSRAQFAGCWERETAWGSCTGETTGQNWQTYVTPSSTLISGSASLVAGQNYNMGTVVAYQEFIGGPVTLTFYINEGWMMDLDEEENVKIDAFDVMVRKLIPGKFAIKSYQAENYFVITGIPSGSYFAIHLDVLRQVDCL
jgi:hypothetical protein